MKEKKIHENDKKIDKSKQKNIENDNMMRKNEKIFKYIMDNSNYSMHERKPDFQRLLWEREHILNIEFNIK